MMRSAALSKVPVPEPTWRFLAGRAWNYGLGNRGRIDVRIAIQGHPAHSSSPQNGCNAITGAMEVIRRLMAIETKASDKNVGRQSLTVTRIRSFPESTHTIQALTEITLDRRLIPAKTRT